MNNLATAMLLAGCASTTVTTETPATEPERISIPTPVEPPPMQLVLADLSGVTNGRWVSKHIAVGGSFDSEALTSLSEGGIQRIINLRTEGEMDWDEAGLSEASGLRYVQLPIGSVVDFSPEWLAEFDRLLGEEVPTLVHCASGNRVGAAFALHAQAFKGASVEDAMTLGERHGLTSMSSAVRQRLEMIER